MEKNENIIASWSFLTFVQNHGGKAFVAPFVDKKKGTPFTSVVCKKNKDDKEEKGTLVNFSSKMGPLSNMEIAQQFNDLQVIQRVVEPEVLARRKAEGRQLETYILCRKGESSWDEIPLPIGNFD